MDAEYIKTRMIAWLLDGNLAFDVGTDAIGLEVPFLGNRRRVDVLVLSEEFHALEIKGDSDNLVRLSKQIVDYRNTFDRVSVVTTPKHIRKARVMAKPSTGLILFKDGTFDIVRRARLLKRLSKDSLVAFFSKRELNRLFTLRESRRLSTGELRVQIARRLPTNVIREAAYASLRDRYGDLFKVFLNDLGRTVLVDDLRGLSGKLDQLGD